ncbi:MAG: tRNA pseudouridine(38-40) synthase TruA [Terrimonas sp.]|nr:tRNA pseudouridine(38-40) synthase TruA [Terrimonas sp.]
MARYFLEVAYKGSQYKGFQVQKNAHTIQGEIEKAGAVLQRQPLLLTGSSRTDGGVHALQNYFHFDYEGELHKDFVYKMNAILPPDIVVRQLYTMPPEAHARFDARSRAYRYVIYRHKDPFLQDRGYYFPYTLDMGLLREAAAILLEYNDFTAFSKKNTQIKTFICQLMQSQWTEEEGCLVYRVEANRFLRGMVRGLVGTMLKVGRGTISVQDFREIIESRDNSRVNFAAPGRGLYLVSVKYPDSYFTS